MPHCARVGESESGASDANSQGLLQGYALHVSQCEMVRACWMLLLVQTERESGQWTKHAIVVTMLESCVESGSKTLPAHTPFLHIDAYREAASTESPHCTYTK